MSKLAVYNSNGKEIGSVSINSDFVKKRVNKRVLYHAVNSYLASQHRGTHKTKKRDEVRGGGKKPWKQKGTGRARTGSIRNPLWRGGGVIFGPVVRSYAYSIPHKAKRVALLEAIRSKIQSEFFVVYDSISLGKPKTKDMASVIKSLKLGKKCLVVMEKVEDNIKLASRNLAGLSVRNRKNINALDVVKHDYLAVSKESLQNLLKGTE